MICTDHQILLGSSDEGELEACGMWLVLGRGDLHGGFWWGKGPHSGLEDNIEMELIGQGGDGVDWIDMAGDRQVADCIEHCNETWVPYRAGNLLTG
jgi:hypothetical protein